MKPITGAWIEFRHHSAAEGKYYNPAFRSFTQEQWKAMVRDMHALGMDTAVLTCTALCYEDERESYTDLGVLPRTEGMGCEDPLQAVMDEMEALDMHIYLAVGFYGVWLYPEKNMTSPEVEAIARKASQTLYERFGHYRCFEGWYLPDETEAGPYFKELFIDYVNRYADFLKAMDPSKKILIAPYGTNKIVCDEHFIDQLKRLNCDIIAYQDEVGVEKSTPEQLSGYFASLRKAHDAAGKSKCWADMEVFRFEGKVYQSALLPAPIERIQKQMENISPYVDKILCYAYAGLMARPGTLASYGQEAETLYQSYDALRKKIGL